jgi:hypothetical protein
MELESRYGDTWELSEVDGGLKFILPPYTRVGYDNEELFFIDPPGGPFLGIGSNLDGKVISEIEDHEKYVILKLEEA